MSRNLSNLRSFAEVYVIRATNTSSFCAAVLVVLLVWEGVSCFLLARDRALWNDELLTLYISRLPSLDVVRAALAAGADGMPITYDLIARLAQTLIRNPPLGVRIPSMLGYLVLLASTYAFARKGASPLASICAVLLIALSPVREYAFEARPYAIVIGCVALAAVLWQRGLEEERRFTAPALALILGLAVACHTTAIAVLAAFAAAELAYAFTRRRLRWNIWIAFGAAALPFVLNFSTVQHYRELYGATFWLRPAWAHVVTTYQYLSSDTNLTIAALIVLLVSAPLASTRGRMRDGAGSWPQGFSAPEWVFLVFLALVPATLVAGTKILHGGYVPRYGLPALFALAIGSVVGLKLAPRTLAAVFLALFAAFPLQYPLAMHRLEKTGNTERSAQERWILVDQIVRRFPGAPLVIDDPGRVLEARYYAPGTLRNRLVEVIDRKKAVEAIGYDTSELNNEILSHFVPLRILALAEFETSSRQAILYSAGGADWLTQYFVARGDLPQLLWRSPDGAEQLYLLSLSHGDQARLGKASD